MKKFLSCFMAAAMASSLFTGMAFTVSASETENETGAEDTMTLSELVQEAGGISEEGSGEDVLDQLYANFNSGINEDGSIDSSVYDYDDSQVSENVETLDAEIALHSFDLRHVGGTVTYNSETKKNDITGGLSYVTSVKFQNPWGTCWAFGITSASEASILYEAGLGSETTVNNNIDLSEHHLAWFAKNHIPAEGEEGYGTNSVNNQDGEGMCYENGTTNKSMVGGMPYYGTSVFATGSGITYESTVPYVGANGEVMCKRKAGADTEKYPKTTLYYDSVDAWNAETDEGIKENYYLRCYSDQDDWSLDESLRFYQAYALEESSILPSVTPTKDAATGKVTLNEDGINAVKSELVEGRAVEMAFYADSSDPNADVTTNTSRYINSNFAHYTWDQSRANHSVCIVGWDDDYDASNFGQAHPVKYDAKNRVIYKLRSSDKQLSYDKDGKLYYEDAAGNKIYPSTDEMEPVREEDGSASVPAGNGAWIVKNSWGSSTNEFPNKNTWGVDGSGYFYVSYYDTSVCMLETYDFVVTDEEKEEYSDYGIIDQYDYMTAEASTQSEALGEVMMANVFTAEEDMVIEALSCETTTPGTSVIYAICLLDDDEDYPTGSSKIIRNTLPIEYEYGGYHRQQLDNPLAVAKGQKYAVLVIEYYLSDDGDEDLTKYFICSHTGYSELTASILGYDSYNNGVVNPGESFIIMSGYNSDELRTVDYYDYLTYVNGTNIKSLTLTYDNFSIKAYATPAVMMYRLYNPNSGEHLYTSSAEEIENLTALGWQNEGEAWAAPKTSETPVYRLYNPNNGDHHYTTNEDEIDMLTELGWTDEGIAWYSGGDCAVSRLFNPNAVMATHHYTGFEDEIENLVSLGWTDEGVAWYALNIPEAEE